MPTRAETDRLRALIETGIAINAELSLDAVLDGLLRQRHESRRPPTRHWAAARFLADESA